MTSSDYISRNCLIIYNNKIMNQTDIQSLFDALTQTYPDQKAYVDKVRAENTVSAFHRAIFFFKLNNIQPTDLEQAEPYVELRSSTESIVDIVTENMFLKRRSCTFAGFHPDFFVLQNKNSRPFTSHIDESDKYSCNCVRHVMTYQTPAKPEDQHSTKPKHQTPAKPEEPDIGSYFDALEETFPDHKAYIDKKRSDNTISSFYQAVCFFSWNQEPIDDHHCGPGIQMIKDIHCTRHGIISTQV